MPAREFLRHLRMHHESIAELMDEECLAALANVEAQYGETRAFVAGLETRIGSPERYVDFIVNTLDGAPFPRSAIWIEMDYQAYRKPGVIKPCLFLNTWEAAEAQDSGQWWNRALVAVAGRDRAKRLRQGLFDVLDKLPQGVCVKQIGIMARPAAMDSLRIVLMFYDWTQIPGTMEAIGWPGSAEALATSLKPYEDMDRMAVNIDLDVSGIRQTAGIEIVPRWRHPVLVDRMVSRLERSGLCLPQKGDALRRWVRIPPSSDPFIQTTISHYKLNYEDGMIVGAKAYLQQTPYPLHGLYPKD